MKLRSLLNRIMYRDRATVYRMVEKETNFVDDYEDVVVYEDIPCKLSQYGKDMLIDTGNEAPEIPENLRMTCDSSYDIQPNDYVIILHQGQRFNLNASRAFKYPTHQEISMLRLINRRHVEE